MVNRAGSTVREPRNRPHDNPMDGIARFFRREAAPILPFRTVRGPRSRRAARIVPSCAARDVEKIVHMQHVAAETLVDGCGERGFAGCARPVYGNEHMVAFGKQRFDMGDCDTTGSRRFRGHCGHCQSSTVRRYEREPMPSSSAYSSVCSPWREAMRSVTEAPSGATWIRSTHA